MEKLLQSWKLDNADELLEIFKDNRIDEKNIAKLTPTAIKELIPRVGTRLEFMEKWMTVYGPIKETTKETGSDTESIQSDFDETNSIKAKDDYTLRRQDAFLGKTMFMVQNKRLNIKNILQRTIQGQAILKSYKKLKQLSRKTRNEIVDIVLSEILATTHCLKNTDLEYLATQIVEVFPTELSTTYYVPPIKKRNSRTHKSITARGKLVDKYRNKLRHYKQLTGHGVSDETSASTSTIVSSSETTPADADDVHEHVSWLKKNSAPWEEVISKWELTTAFRRREIEDHCDVKAYTIFDRWPLLKHPQGYDLIKKDYASLNLSTVEIDIETWTTFYENILKVCQFKKDSNAEALYALLQQEDITEDCKVALQVLLLPHIIPPKGRVRINKTHWKPSISECKDSILMHATIFGDVIKIQEKRSEAMRKLGLTAQPFIIIVGPTICDLSTFYVSIDNTLYKVPSTLQALDICFKTYHALNLAYPPESEHLWLLFQASLYRFTTKWDKTIPYVMQIVKEVSEQSKENINPRSVSLQ